MRQIYLIISVIIIGLGSVLLLNWVMQPPAVQAQADPNAPDAPHTLYLPVIARSVPTPTPTPSSRIKSKNGIHLGNRSSSDWRQELFTNISTATVTGTWPAAVVVQSDQVFTLKRETTGLCRVTEAILKLTGEGEPYNAFKYLTAAIKAGTRVIIRITPSPGNFVDYDQPSDNHQLRIDDTPAGGNYCDENVEGKRTVDKVGAYRDILELAQEMDAIYQLSVVDHKWPAANLYFEPANEPNIEWYQNVKPITGTVLIPNADNKLAWIAMDDYFAALYDRAKQIKPTLQILAPSMSQGAYGEHYMLGTCNSAKMMVVDGNGRTGLDFMKKTYGYDLGINSYTTPKADGFAFHNYWREDQEAWEPDLGIVPTLDNVCPGDEKHVPKSDHLYQYLSGGMQVNMAGRPIFITEADLQSPCQNDENAIGSKDQLPDGSNGAYRTRESLLKFVNQEYGAQYVITWVLVNEYPAEDNTCADDHPNFEINWHEAYLESGDERLWFTLWWQDAQ